MAINLDALVLHLIINIIILSPVLWLSGRAIVGKKKAKFTDAILTVAIGTVVGTFFGALFTGLIATIIQLAIWLLIVRHFFECGWLRALAISLLAIIIFAVTVLILGFLGFAIFHLI